MTQSSAAVLFYSLLSNSVLLSSAAVLFCSFKLHGCPVLWPGARRQSCHMAPSTAAVLLIGFQNRSSPVPWLELRGCLAPWLELRGCPAPWLELRGCPAVLAAGARQVSTAEAAGMSGVSCRGHLVTQAGNSRTRGPAGGMAGGGSRRLGPSVGRLGELAALLGLSDGRLG